MNIPSLRFSEFTSTCSAQGGGEWVEKKLGDVCIKIQDGNYGAKYPKADEFLSSGIPFLTSKAIQNGVVLKDKIDYISNVKHAELKKAQLQLNDVLFTNRGSKVGNISCVDNSISHGNIGPQLTLLRVNKNIFSSLFLFQTMNTYKFQKQIKSQDSGSAMNFFGIADTSKFKLHTPSKPEQQKIATFLSAVDSSIEQLTKKEKLLRAYKKGVMQKIFSREIRFRDDDGGVFDEWVEKRLGEIVLIQRGASPRPIQKFISNEGMNWIKIGDIKEGAKYLEKTEQKITLEGSKKSRIIEPNDFILSNSMSFGRPYISKIHGCIHDGWLLLRNKDKAILSNNFLYELLSSEYIKKQFKSLAAGSTVNNLKSETVKNVKINLSSLKEQTKIANFLSSLDEKITQTHEALEAKRHFKKGLLQKMFV